MANFLVNDLTGQKIPSMLITVPLLLIVTTIIGFNRGELTQLWTGVPSSSPKVQFPPTTTILRQTMDASFLIVSIIMVLALFTLCYFPAKFAYFQAKALV